MNPSEVKNELALFAGAGGGILGGVLLGWRTVCAVEIDPYARRVLLARQNDGCLQTFPVYDDVCAFDGTRWRGRVDIVTGGFPCQDISVAGNGAGIDGERSRLWKEMSRIIGEIRPNYVLVENSPMLTIRGGVRVIGDLAAMGYDCKWGIIGGGDAGAIHERNRIWIVAYSNYWKERNKGRWEESILWKCGFSWCQNVRRLEDLQNRPDLYDSTLCRSYDGLAQELEQVQCVGNGQIPCVVKLAWETLTKETNQ